jgi:hypothetical protein
MSKKRIQGWLKNLLASSFIFAICVNTFAASRSDVEALHNTIKANRKNIVIEVMDLSDTESEKFWEIYDEYAFDLKKNTDMKLDIIRQYMDNFETMPPKLAETLVRDFLKSDKNRANLRTRYIRKFKKAISERKLLRFYQVENKMDAIINYVLAENIPLHDWDDTIDDLLERSLSELIE